MPDITPSNEHDHWPCACVRRRRNGALSHIKLNHPSVKKCEKCGAEQPEDQLAGEEA